MAIEEWLTLSESLYEESLVQGNLFLQLDSRFWTESA